MGRVTSTFAALGSMCPEHSHVLHGRWPRYHAAVRRQVCLCKVVIPRLHTRRGVLDAGRCGEPHRNGGQHPEDLSTRRTVVLVVRSTLGVSLKWGHHPSWTVDGGQCVAVCPVVHIHHSYLYDGCRILDGGFQPECIREPRVLGTGCSYIGTFQP